MTARAWIRNASLAVVLGVIWPSVVLHLFAFGAYVILLVNRVVTAIGFDATWPVVRTFSTVLWALALGVLFGVPLGLGVRRKVMTYWFVFVASAIATSAVLSLRSEFGVAIVLLEWSLPETWMYMFAVLCLAYSAARFRERRERRHVVAP